MFYCMSCHKVIPKRIYRFPVCDCGHSELCSDEQKRYVFFEDDNSIQIRTSMDPVENTETIHGPAVILSAIIGLPVWNANLVMTKILNQITNEKERKYVKGLAAWQAIAHIIQKKHSHVYQLAVEKQFWDFAFEILLNGKILSVPVNVQQHIDCLMKLWDKIELGQGIKAFRALSSGYEDNKAVLMANLRLTPENIQSLTTRFDDLDAGNVLCMAEQLAYNGMVGKEIVQTIGNHRAIYHELKKMGISYKIGVKSPDEELFEMQRIRRINVRIATKQKFQLKQVYKDKSVILPSETAKNYGYNIVVAPYEQAEPHVHMFPYSDEMKFIPWLIQENKQTVGIVLFGEDILYYSGKYDDHIKLYINEVLDISEQNTEQVLQFLNLQ